MLIVEIYIGDRLIGKETALRVKGDMQPNTRNTYQLSDGTEIKHRYGDGAARLAELMMKHLAKKGHHDK